MIPAIPLVQLATVGHGVSRPESVLVLQDRVFVSDDGDAAVTEILPDGTIRRLGHAPGQTTGLSALGSQSIVLALFDTGQVLTLDLKSEELDLLADTADGQALTCPNFPLAGPDGVVWVSCTTRQADPLVSIGHRSADGYIVRVDPDGRATLAADGIPFANCMAFGPDPSFVYVVRSTLSDVARYQIGSDRELHLMGRYGPALGDRRDHEVGDDYEHAQFDPEVGRRWALTDGCAFDAEGNLWVTIMSANRIVAVTPQGSVVTVIDDPDGSIMAVPTSIAWGGPDMKDLYIGSLVTPYVIKTRSPTAGLRLWHQTADGRATLR